MIDLRRIIDIRIGTDGNNQLGVQPWRAHRKHQRVIDVSIARAIELENAGESCSPSWKTDVVNRQAHLGEAIVEYRLMA